MTQTPISHFFETSPQSKPLFDDVAVALLSRYPQLHFKIQKTQIALISTKPFAAIWLPIRSIKDRPELYLILSFGLDEHLNHPRIIEVNEPYPKRFMHHVLISSGNELDETLFAWLDKAIVFSNRKR